MEKAFQHWNYDEKVNMSRLYSRWVELYKYDLNFVSSIHSFIECELKELGKKGCVWDHVEQKRIEPIIKPLNLQGVYQLLTFTNLFIWVNAWYGGSFLAYAPLHRSPKKFAKKHGYLFIITYDYNHL